VKNLILPFLLVFAPAAAAAQECPALLILKMDHISTRDTAMAQRYANCISPPWLPIATQRAAKLAQCKQDRPNNPGRQLKEALDWVDHIAASFPGCETNLKIEKQ
jgi:hypothetical protein